MAYIPRIVTLVVLLAVASLASITIGHPFPPIPADPPSLQTPAECFVYRIETECAEVFWISESARQEWEIFFVYHNVLCAGQVDEPLCVGAGQDPRPWYLGRRPGCNNNTRWIRPRRDSTGAWVKKAVDCKEPVFACHEWRPMPLDAALICDYSLCCTSATWPMCDCTDDEN